MTDASSSVEQNKNQTNAENTSSPELTLNQMTVYDLVNFADKESTKMDMALGSNKLWVTYLRFPSKTLAERLKTFIDFYLGFVEDLEKVNIIQVDKKLVDFIASPEFKKIINSTEPLLSLQDELNALDKNTPQK